MTYRSRHFVKGGVLAVLIAVLATLALAAAPEAPVTQSATGVSSTEATLHVDWVVPSTGGNAHA